MNDKTELKKIEVIQAPVIKFDHLEATGEQIKKELAAMQLDKLVVTEDSLKSAKETRTRLNKELEAFENQRKLAKDMILAPYELFNESYNSNIKEPYANASKDLKSAIDRVTGDLLSKREDEIKEHFFNCTGGVHPFLNFNDIGLKIMSSKSNKYYTDKIDLFLDRLNKDLSTIESLQESNRIRAKFEINGFDLSDAISSVNNDIAREKKIESANKTKEKARQSREIQESIQFINEPEIEPEISKPKKTKEPMETFEVSFKVTGDISSIKALKAFMESQNLDYEQI